MFYLRRKCQKFPWKLAYSTHLTAPGQITRGSVPSLNKRCFITISSSLGKLGLRIEGQGREVQFGRKAFDHIRLGRVHSEKNPFFSTPVDLY
jgi:hypothetical protein